MVNNEDPRNCDNEQGILGSMDIKLIDFRS